MLINKIIYYSYILYLFFVSCNNVFGVDKNKNLIDNNFNIKFNWIYDFYISTLIVF